MKGEVSSQVFTYILAAVIVGLILIVGYKGISTIMGVTSQAPIDDFKSDFTAEVEKMSRDYGSVKKYELPGLPTKIEEVCFIDSMNENNEFDILPSIADNAFIELSIEDNSQKNVFLLKDGKIQESFYVEHLDVVNDYLCLENVGAMELWFEGKGKTACLKKDRAETC
jgi:hypothetical protein